MRRLFGAVYLYLIRRAPMFSPDTISKVTDDIFQVIREQINPPVTNHVIGDLSPVGDVPPPAFIPDRATPPEVNP